MNIRLCIQRCLLLGVVSIWAYSISLLPQNFFLKLSFHVSKTFFHIVCFICSIVFLKIQSDRENPPLKIQVVHYCFQIKSQLFTMVSVQFSHSVMSNTLQPHELQHTRPPCPSSNSWNLPKLMCIESVMPSKHLILLLPSPPTLNISQHQGLFK